MTTPNNPQGQPKPAPTPLLARRPALLTVSQLERIEEAIKRILAEVGIAVKDEDLQKRLAARGFHASDGRVRIPRQAADEFIESERHKSGHKYSEQPLPAAAARSPLTLSVSGYPLRVHDLDSGRLAPFTAERLIEAVKLVDALYPRGTMFGPPGYPADAPPALQPLMQYWIAAVHAQHPPFLLDAKTAPTLAWLMEMTAVMGNPIRWLPVYVISPLTLGGDSLQCALKYHNKITFVMVSNMASLGGSAPIHAGDALALAAAEVIGSALLLREIFDFPVGWLCRLCAADLASLATALGSPEDLLLQLMNAEVNAFLHGTGWQPGSTFVHTSAKLPGAQACAEKASLMTAGALLGSRDFGVAGTLSLDEVFSAEQLLYDLEIKDHVQRMVRGMDGDCDPERCLRDVRLGLESQMFAGLDTTLEHYRDVYWVPRLFERRFLAAWEGQGAVTIRRKAHDEVRELVKRHEYMLDSKRRGELDKILARAREELA